MNTGQNLGPREAGELCFRGPGIMKGYCGNSQATAASFDSDGFLLTGDVGYYDEDGFFYIVDRVKELIKYKGYQVKVQDSYLIG
jgi:long-subunit acyl-CoA synthetase (AMP-forming)